MQSPVSQVPAGKTIAEELKAKENTTQSTADGQDHPSPSREAVGDPAPVNHAQMGMSTKGQYEAAEPFRSRKGDRFS
jgi:hypothetical protein